MEAKAVAVDRRINLKGEVCPYTFVKSKLALEAMSPGQVLEVLVDYPLAVEEIPRSMAGEGHEVLAITPGSDGDWAIAIRKK